MAALVSAPVFADEFADVSKFIRAGQFVEALNKVDAVLAQRPRDAQMRFLKGLILTEQNKSAEAIAIFTKMTEDFPELPEPYNNLAVLYASSGQYEKARAALESAIRTNPTYATAHENLGDVYAKLASQSYDKALQLDSANSSAKSKLTMVRTLVGTGGGGTSVAAGSAKSASAPTTLAAASKPAPPIVLAKVEPAKVEAPKAEPKPVAKPPAKADEVKAEAKPAPKAETKQEAKAEPKAKPEPKNNGGNDKDEALKAVHNWARAWSSMDVKGYLASYSGDFQTPKGESHKAWAEERRDRIESKGRISVQIESPQVTVDGSTATVKFRQIYTSDRLTAKSKKVLVLAKQGGKWQIKQERSAN